MSKPQKWCPNYTQFCPLAESGGLSLTVPRGTLRVSPPLLRPISVLAPDSLGNTQRTNAKVLVFPTCLPTTGEGWPKAMKAYKTPVC